MDFEKIGEILLFTLGLYVISAAFSFIQGYLMSGISQKTTYRLRKEISEKINRMPMNYFDTKTHGEVLSRVTNDVDTLGQSLNQSATQMITSVTTLIGVLVMMLSISPLMTLVALLILPVSMADLRYHETFPEIFPRAAGIFGRSERTGGGSIFRSQYRESI